MTWLLEGEELCFVSRRENLARLHVNMKATYCVTVGHLCEPPRRGLTSMGARVGLVSLVRSLSANCQPVPPLASRHASDIESSRMQETNRLNRTICISSGNHDYAASCHLVLTTSGKRLAYSQVVLWRRGMVAACTLCHKEHTLRSQDGAKLQAHVGVSLVFHKTSL